MALTGGLRSFPKRGISSSCSKRVQKVSKSASQITSLKTQIREISPICISQKKVPTSCSTQVHEDVDFVKQLENRDECSWLSSEEASLTLQEEWEILQQDLKEADVLESLLLNSADTELKYSSIMFFENVKSSCETSTSVSSDNDISSPFSDLEVIEAQLSLINLDADDSEWISNVHSELQELQSDILSPTHEIIWASDFCSSGRSTTSPNNSTPESSQDEMALELLSVNWDQLDFDEPLFWPFHEHCDWCSMWDSFCQPPCEGMYGLRSPKDEFATPGSIGQKLGQVKNSRAEWKKRFLYVARLHASKITKFKRRCQKLAAAQRIKVMYSRLGRAAEEIIRRVHLVMDNGFEEATETEVNSIRTNGKLSKEQEDVGSSCGQSTCKYSISNENPLTPFSSYTDSSLLWGLDKKGRTETRVCSINLESEDSRCISNAGLEWEELKSIYKFPSDTHKISWGSECCPLSISAASTIDSMDKKSQNVLSSDLLSEFTLDFDEPLFWPFDKSYDWSQMRDPFCPSPPRCIYDLQSPEDAFETPISVRLRQYGRKTNFKEGQKRRRFLHVSGPNAVNITEFKRISSKNAAARRMKAVQFRFAKSPQEFMRMVSRMDYNVEGINEAEVNTIGAQGKLLEEDVTKNEKVLTEVVFSPNDFRVHNIVDQQPSSSQSSQYGYSMSPEDSTTTSSTSDSSTESSSLLWDLERIDMWLCLINLEAEDSMWISYVDPEWEDLKPGSPSLPFIDRSTCELENSQDDPISELLSGSMDIGEMDFEEPLFWPFDKSCRWSATWDCFCLSPR